MFGYKANEILGKSVNLLIGGGHNGLHDSYINRYLATGKGRIIGSARELEAKRKDDSIFPIYISVSEMYIGGEKHFTGIIRDISDQKRSDSKLRESEKNYRSLFQQSNDAIIILDENTIFDCNPAALNLFGCPDKKAFLGLTFENLSSAKQFDGVLTSEAINQKFIEARQQSSLLFEWYHQRVDDHREIIAKFYLAVLDGKAMMLFRLLSETLVCESNQSLNSKNQRNSPNLLPN